jgi:hypothetical protein
MTSLVAAGPATAASTTYYVDGVNGLNTNDGTSLGSAFKTIQRAADAAQAGDKVLIRGGTYRETVTAPRSGTAGNPIYFDNYQGENVTISGTDVVTSAWVLDSGSVYRTSTTLSLGDENQVFVNGTMINEAQWPNDTDLTDKFNLYYATVNQGTDSGSLTSITDAAIGSKPSGYFVGAAVWWLAEYKWVALGSTITTSSGNTVNFSTPTTAGNWEKDYHNPGVFSDGANQYVIIGDRDLLDVANEWYYNSGTLYVQLPSGSAPSANSVEVKKRNVAFDFSEKDYIDVGGVNVFAAAVKMSGDHGAWTDGTLSHTHHNSGRSVGEFYPGGEGSYGNVIAGNNNYFGFNTISIAAASGVNVTGDENHIDWNYVSDTGYKSSYDEAIRLAPSAERARVTSNTIVRTGQVCIGAGWNDNASHFIAYNDCSKSQLLGDDRGGIQAKGSEVAYNKVHDIGRGLGRAVTPAFYTDTSGDNVTYHHNVAYSINYDATFRVNDTGNPANGNSNIKIYNNTAYGTPNDLILYFNSSASTGNNLHNPPASYFVNAAGGDLRLAASSPAINAGAVLSPWTDGYSGSAPDLGAYEYGASTSRSAWTAGVGAQAHFGPTVETNQAINGGFETNASNYGQTLTGWTTDGYGSHADADYTETTGGAYEGTYHGTHYKGTPYEVYTSQTLTGLTNGSYTLTARVKSSGGQTYSLMDVKNYGGSIRQASIPAQSSWTLVTIANVSVTNNQATIGFYSNSAGGDWLYFDDVRFVKQ